MNLKARTNLSLVVFVCYFLAIQSLAKVVEENLDSCTNVTSTDCCLCSQASCDTDCPPSLFRLVSSSNTHRCNLSDIEMGITTVYETTTIRATTLLSLTKSNTAKDLNATEHLETTTEFSSMHSTDSTDKTTQIIVCVTRCPTGYFHDGGNCTKCDTVCKECNSSGSDGCLKCKLTFNNTCYAVCPVNTVQRNFTCVDKESKRTEDNNDKKLLPIIIGASLGGAAVVIVVVVVIVCCCRKRRESGAELRKSGTKSKRTALSELSEDKKNKDPKEKKGKGPRIPRKDYENTARRDSTLKHAIPNQGDLVLRYTKDPTESVKANTLKPVAPEPKNRDSTYANEATIQNVKNIVDEPTVSEQQEIAALPLAPMAPPGTPDQDSGRRHRKSKVPFTKRISKKLKPKKKEKGKPPVDEAGQDYIDMSHTTPVTERKSDNQSTDHDEEDYENTPEKMAKNQSKPVKPQPGVKYEKTQTGIKSGKSHTGINSRKKQTGDEDGLEDYENAPEKLETQSKVNPREVEQEDYEVMNEGRQAEDQLEDYENIKPLAKADNTKKPVIPVGKTKELMKKFEKSKVPVKNVADDAAELEDYENKKGTTSKSKAAETKKKGVKKVTEPDPASEDGDGLEDYENTAFFADTEEPYENVKMEEGKMKPRNP